jgi:hypothetical protein
MRRSKDSGRISATSLGGVPPGTATALDRHYRRSTSTPRFPVFFALSFDARSLVWATEAMAGGLSSLKIQGSYPDSTSVIIAVIECGLERRAVPTASRNPPRPVPKGLDSPFVDLSDLAYCRSSCVSTPIAVATVIVALVIDRVYL